MKVADIRMPRRLAGAGRRRRWSFGSSSAARLVLVFCLAVTVWTWHLSRVDARRQGRDEFEQITGQITQAVHDRMRAYEQVLRGAVGLFLAAGEVTRRDWRIYVENLALDKSYPGIQGVGFARLIAPAEREAHIRRIRAEGFADYTLWPAGERDTYTAIVYLEPFNWRNRRAFGYDMFSEPVRRAAMERAWGSGETAVSGKITLVQETGRDPQAGFLMYLPLYAGDRPAAGEAQRRAALRGWVYSPFRMDDLMQGILGRQLANVALTIYDGRQVSAEALLYQSGAAAADYSPAFASTATVDINGRPWTLRFASLPAFEAAVADRERSLVNLAGGAVISLLLYAVIRALVNQRARALALAETMTAELRRDAAERMQVQDALKEAKEALERRVAERTAELAEANERLRHDIAERLQTEKALRETAERLRAVVETAVDAIIVIDERGLVEAFNPAAEKMFGYGGGEVLGRNVNMLMPSPYREEHDQYLRNYLTTGVRKIIGIGREVTARRKDGSVFPIELAVSEMRLGDTRKFTGTVRDITQRKAAEQEIRRMNAELEQRVARRTAQLEAANKELESFSYSVSHDLRAPLRAVDGFAQILEEDYAPRLDDEGRRLLTVIRDSSRQMGQLIDDLLSFSRLGRQAMTLIRVDMNALVGAVIEEMASRNPDAPVRFQVQPLAEAWCDAALIRQVWINLLANAVKFSSRQPQPIVEVSGYCRDQEQVYVVKDNGAGFDMKYYDKLFGVFQRLHSSGQFPGTGVGLATVQRIVARHGGRVWADSVVGRGAAFYFSLPRGADHAAV